MQAAAMARCRSAALLALSLLTVPGAVFAEPTEVTVRVIARGAMFVGDLVEGAQVTITDAVSGEMLAQGVTRGKAGEPGRLMGVARKRGEPLAAADDARFHATLELDEPRLVQVTAFGPLQWPGSATRTSMTQWVVPGRHLDRGDGWIIELAGLIVEGDVAATTVDQHEAAAGVTVSAEVGPMCGCPVGPDFHWDAEDYDVAASVKRGEAHIGSYALRYAGSANDFTGTLRLELPGVYEITVHAYELSSGNTGIDRLTLTVTDR